MGKRQFRIFRKDIFAKKADLQGQEGHVIMENHVVIHGRIIEISANYLALQDPRLHIHNLELSQITEVVYDKETEY